MSKSTISPTRWLRRPVAGQPAVTVADVLVTSALTGWMVYLVGWLSPGKHLHGGVAVAAIAATTMTIPVAWRRQAPTKVAAALAAAAILNGFAIGHSTRCGSGLPALFFTAYSIGRLLSLRSALPGLALLWLAGAVQAFTDPQLQHPLAVILGVLCLAFYGAGRLVTSRIAMVAELRARSNALRAQREENAKLAVAADKVRIAEDLNDQVRQRLNELSALADVERSDDAAALRALAEIESIGRSTLTSMREVVGALRPSEAPTAPQPVLAQLGRLLERATTADTRLRVVGTPVSLAPGVELSGYRIVENLLVAMEDDPSARIDVTVAFESNVLEITVHGPAAPQSEHVAAVRAARERASVHGGTVDARTSEGQCRAVARLPVVPAHA